MTAVVYLRLPFLQAFYQDNDVWYVAVCHTVQDFQFERINICRQLLERAVQAQVDDLIRVRFHNYNIILFLVVYTLDIAASYLCARV
jgi:hypothetical protein